MGLEPEFYRNLQFFNLQLTNLSELKQLKPALKSCQADQRSWNFNIFSD